MVEYSFKKEDIKKITKQYVWTFIPPLMAIGIVYSAYSIIKLILSYIHADYALVKESWLDLIIPAICFIISIVRYFVTLKRVATWFNGMQDDGQLKITVDKEDDAIIIRKEVSGEEFRFTLQAIKKEVNTKEYIFITLHADVLVILPRDERIIVMLNY